MSEGCCSGGACSHKAKSTSSGAIQNGKGDTPRNISAKFRKNFDGIRWSAKKTLRPGEKFVKSY